MKKIKLALLAVLLLTTVLVLASCGAKSLVDLVDTEYAPADTYAAYANVASESALTDMSASTASSSGNLKLFTKTNEGLTKYVVYDVANGKVLWQAEETKSESATFDSKTTYTVVFASIKGSDYFTVTTTVTNTTKVENGPSTTDTTVTKAIWAWNGTAYAELVKVTTPRAGIATTQDLLYFEGKIYRVDEETKAIAYAFDYSMLSDLPQIEYSTENYYVVRTNGMWVTYDKELNQVSAFALPGYADMEFSTVLGDKIVAQYFVAEDMFGDTYDVLYEGIYKASVYTVLIDVEKGTTKNIKTDYVLNGTVAKSTNDSWTEDYGFAALEKKEAVIVKACKIENKQVDDAEQNVEWLMIDEKGSITTLKFPTAVRVDNATILSANTWLVKTIDGRAYVMNGEGEILGEVDLTKVNSTQVEKLSVVYTYYVANGKLYDRNFNEVFDFAAEKLTVEQITRKSVIFTNNSNEVIIYANGQKTTLINATAAKESTRSYQASKSDLAAGYFTIMDTSNKDNTKYEIYNAEGKLIKTVDGVQYCYISTAATAEDNVAALVKITTKAKTENATEVVNYYRFS